MKATTTFLAVALGVVALPATALAAPDLTTTITGLNTTPTQNGTDQVDVYAWLSGTSLQANTYVDVKIYLSTNNTYEAGDTLLWQSNNTTPDFDSDTINAQTYQSRSATLTFSASPGTYYVLSRVDGTSFHAESNEGNNVAAYQIQIQSSSPPAAPTGVSAVYQSSSTRNYVTWSAVSGATSYRVYWGTSPGVTTGSNVLGPTSTTDFGHTGVVAGTTYYYRVAAINGAGQGNLSSEVSVTVPSLPATPTGVSAVYQSASARNYVTWSAVSGATSYRVYWGTSPGVTTGSNVLGPTSTTDFGHTGVVAGTTYYYRVAAINGAGQGNLSSEVSVTVPSVPAIPTGVSVVYQSASTRNYVAWNAVSGATSYRVYWGTSPGVTTGSNVLGPTSTTDFGHTGVVGGTTYYYRVAAINGAGQGGLSSTTTLAATAGYEAIAGSERRYVDRRRAP